MEIVLDTSVLVALLVPGDLWHNRAVELWNAIKAAGHQPLYFDCVLAETISTATRRLYERKQSDQVGALLDKLNEQAPHKLITWVLPDVSRLYPLVLDQVRTSAGALNFNDALIALACRERGIPAVASFDADFDAVGWLRRFERGEDLAS